MVQPLEAYKGSAIRGGQGTRGTLAIITNTHNLDIQHTFWNVANPDPLRWGYVPFLHAAQGSSVCTILPVLTLGAGMSPAHGTYPSGHLGMCTQGDPCAFPQVLWGHPLLVKGWVE